VSKFIVSAVLVGFGIAAYILGSKAGQQRFREVSDVAKRFWNDPTVAKVRDEAYRRVDKAAQRVADKLPG
jgi:hypothetical protein